MNLVDKILVDPITRGLKFFTKGGVVVSQSPVGMSDQLATQLGLKQYLHGTTYNGGNAPTVACSQAGTTINRGLFIPYQVQDGIWRLKFNISIGFTSTSITSLPAVSTSGISFKTGVLQAVAASLGGSTIGNFQQAWANPGAGSLFVSQTAGAATNSAFFAGDVELDSKPTWAY